MTRYTGVIQGREASGEPYEDLVNVDRPDEGQARAMIESVALLKGERVISVAPGEDGLVIGEASG